MRNDKKGKFIRSIQSTLAMLAVASLELLTQEIVTLGSQLWKPCASEGSCGLGFAEAGGCSREAYGGQL